MPGNSDRSGPAIPPAQPPSDRLGGEREVSDLKYPSAKEHTDLAQRVAVLESEMKHLAKREDLEKVKTWTMTMQNSGLMALAAALGSAIVTMIALSLKWL